MEIGFIIFLIIVVIIGWQTFINRHNNWTIIGDSSSGFNNVPVWVNRYISKHSRLWNMDAPKYRGKYITIKGKHYRYKIGIDGQSATYITVSRKLRRRFW